MKETILSLLKLAEVDYQIDEIRNGKKEIPEKVKELQEDLYTIRDTVKDLEAKKDELQERVKELKGNVEEKMQWLSDRESKLNDIASTKEYQAAQKEVSFAKKTIKDCEDELKIKEPEADAAEKNYQSTRDELIPKAEQIKAQLLDYKDKFENSEKHLKEKSAARLQFVGAVADKKALTYYEKVRQSIYPSISMVDPNGICRECGTKILPITLNKLQVGDEWQACDRCRRIVYLEEVLK